MPSGLRFATGRMVPEESLRFRARQMDIVVAKYGRRARRATECRYGVVDPTLGGRQRGHLGSSWACPVTTRYPAALR